MSLLLPPPGRAVGRLAASCLALEALLVLFATLVALRLSPVPDTVVWAAGGGLALACLLAAGLARLRVGLVLGLAIQLLLLVSALWVPAMLLMGAVFVVLWFWLMAIGVRIDREPLA